MANTYERFRNIYQPSFYNEFCRKCRLSHISAENLLQFIKQPTNNAYFRDFVVSANSLEQMMKITKWLKTTQKYTRMDMDDITKRMMGNVGIDEFSTLYSIAVKFDNYDTVLFHRKISWNDCNLDKEIEFIVMKYGIINTMTLIQSYFQNDVDIQKCTQLQMIAMAFIINSPCYSRHNNVIHKYNPKLSHIEFSNKIFLQCYAVIRELSYYWSLRCCIFRIMTTSQNNYATCNADILFADDYVVKCIFSFL